MVVSDSLPQGSEIWVYFGDFIVLSVVFFILGRYTYNRFLRRDKRPHTEMDTRLLLVAMTFITGMTFLEHWHSGEVTLGLIASGVALVLFLGLCFFGPGGNAESDSEGDNRGHRS